MKRVRSFRTDRRLALLAAALVAAMCAGGAAAHVNPDGVFYQGLVVDADGVPLNERVDLHFAIYEVEVKGTPIWTETHEGVVVIDGVFQVELGSRGSLDELPFDASYYLGVRVDGDSEMTPRQPLASVLYALRAQEANRLQGFEPGDLDQSEHVRDGANPHGVTAAQVGAADEAALVAHTEDDANPHGVSPGQIGAALVLDLEDHSLRDDAHHARYSDAESVVAMGVKATSNPLNHDRYSDARVLAVTGPHVTSVDGLSGGAIGGDVVITESLAVQGGVVFGDDTRQATAASFPNRILVAPSGGHFTSIQVAIDAIEPSAESPWRIDIAPGSYPERLKLKSWIHLAGSGIRGTVVVLSESAESGVSAEGVVDVKLSNLTLLDPLGSPTANYGVDARGSNLSFEKVRIEGFGAHRIRALEGSAIQLRHSEIDGGFESGSPGILLLDSSAVISNSDFDHNVDCGVDVQRDGVLDVSSSRFAWSPNGVCVSDSRARARIVDNRFDSCGVSSRGTAQIIGNEIGDRVFIEGGEHEVVGNRILSDIEVQGGRGRISANSVGAGISVFRGDLEIVGNRVEGHLTNQEGSVRALGNSIAGNLEFQSGVASSQIVGNQVDGDVTVDATDVLVFGNHASGSVSGDRIVAREDFELSSEAGTLTLQTASGAAEIELSPSGDITIRAGGDLTLEGTNVSIRATAELDLEGSAGAELSTSGILDLKGSLININ